MKNFRIALATQGLLALCVVSAHGATTLWWDTDFTLRQNLTVNTGPTSPDKGYQDYTLRITGLNTSVLIGAGELQADCDDLRVVYFDGAAWQELVRHVINCDATDTDVRFASPVNLATSTSDTNFYLYYGNASAPAPTALSTTNVYLWFDDASVNNQSAYLRGRGDPWHGTGWDNSLTWNAAGYYTYDNGDNFTSTYRRAVDERDVYVEAEFFHTACYQLNMTTGVIVRGIATGSGGGESSSHYYASNRGQQNGVGCNTGGYSQDGDIFKNARANVAVDGSNPPAIIRNQWRRQGLAAWSVNGTNLEFWDEDSSAAWSALGYPDAGNSHIAGVDSSAEHQSRGYAGFITAQDVARVRNVLIRRYTSPEPGLTLGVQEPLPGATLSMTKTASTQFDPVNGPSNPKAIPGAYVDYTLLVRNDSTTGSSDADSIIITDPLPSNVSLFVGDLPGAGGGPVEFLDGAGVNASGLTYTYTSPGSTTDDLSFSIDGNNFNYVPFADADGFDPGITHLRVTPRGTLNVAPAGGAAQFSLRFRVRVD